MFSSQCFCSKSPVNIIMGKGIGHIYKFGQRNYPYPSPNTTFSIPLCFDTSIQTLCSSASNDFVGAHDEASDGLDNSIKTQPKSASDASAGANDVSSYGLDQSTNHNYNTYRKNNYNSQSYETPQKKIPFPLFW